MSHTEGTGARVSGELAAPRDSRAGSPVPERVQEPVVEGRGFTPVVGPGEENRRGGGAPVMYGHAPAPFGGGGYGRPPVRGRAERNVPFGSRYAQSALENGTLGGSNVIGEYKLRAYFRVVLANVSELDMATAEDFDGFVFCLADDAIRNLSSVKGIETGQHVSMYVGDEQVIIDRLRFYSAMFGGNVEEAFLTRVHRGVRGQITTLLANEEYLAMLRGMGITETDRMDYLLLKSGGRAANQVAREAALVARLTEA